MIYSVVLWLATLTIFALGVAASVGRDVPYTSDSFNTSVRLVGVLLLMEAFAVGVVAWNMP